MIAAAVKETARAEVEVAASKAREPLLRLLRAYWHLFRLLNAMPAAVWTPRSSHRLGRHIRTPRLRWFLRPMVAFHIGRSVAALRRAYCGTLATDDPAVDRADLDLLEEFQQSIPPLGIRRIVSFIVVGGFLLSYALANLIHAHQTRYLGDFTSAIVELDRSGAVHAFDHMPAHYITGALLLPLWSLWLVMRVPAMAFELKRAAFDLIAGSPRTLADSPSSVHRRSCGGVYELECDAFGALGLRPPREVPLDLLTRGVLIFSAFVMAIGGETIEPSGWPLWAFLFVVAVLASAWIVWTVHARSRVLKSPKPARGGYRRLLGRHARSRTA